MDQKKKILGKSKKVKINLPGVQTIVGPIQSDGFQTISGTIGSCHTHSADLKVKKDKAQIRKAGAMMTLTADELTHVSIAHLREQGYDIV